MATIIIQNKDSETGSIISLTHYAQNVHCGRQIKPGESASIELDKGTHVIIKELALNAPLETTE